MVSASTGGGPTIDVARNEVSSQYFDILRVPLLKGRGFSIEEASPEAPVAILSAGAAARLFAGRDPLAQTIRLEAPERVVRIVGVASDIVTCCIAYGKDAAVLYSPASPSKTGNLLVHVRGEVETERHRLDTLLAALAPGAINDIHSLDQYRAVGIYAFQVASMIGMAVGGLALFLTLSGIYGVVSFFVTQRTKEIGIRVALGATTLMVTTLVLRQALRLASIGISAGVLLGIGVARVLASQMIFLRVFDGAAFAAGVLLVLSTALAAGYVPSRRAAEIDPINNLRYD